MSGNELCKELYQNIVSDKNDIIFARKFKIGEKIGIFK